MTKKQILEHLKPFPDDMEVRVAGESEVGSREIVDVATDDEFDDKVEVVILEFRE